MVRPILYVARVDATVWAGSSDHALEFGSTSRETAKGQDQVEHEEMTKVSRLGGEC